MHPIEGILFDPVGALAEFPADEFKAIAIHLLGGSLAANASASQAYWDAVNLLDARGWPLDAPDKNAIEAHEIRAVAQASLYEDAVPALSELKALGVRLVVASSLSEAALGYFLDRFTLRDAFAGSWSRDTSSGVKRAPLIQALTASTLTPDRTLFLADTAGGLQTAREAGVQAILMMNDPDEAMRLTAHDPAGGIVSLHELPDFVRIVAAENAR